MQEQSLRRPPIYYTCCIIPVMINCCGIIFGLVKFIYYPHPLEYLFFTFPFVYLIIIFIFKIKNFQFSYNDDFLFIQEDRDKKENRIMYDCINSIKIYQSVLDRIFRTASLLIILKEAVEKEENFINIFFRKFNLNLSKDNYFPGPRLFSDEIVIESLKQNDAKILFQKISNKISKV